MLCTCAFSKCMACDSSCHVHNVTTTSASSHADAVRIRLHGHSLSVQALTPCCWMISVWLACCTAREPFGGTASRFGSATGYSCARSLARTTTPHRSGTSRVHGLSRVPLQAQQSITNSDLRLLVTVSWCVPGVLCIFDVSATSLSQLHMTAAAKMICTPSVSKVFVHVPRDYSPSSNRQWFRNLFRGSGVALFICVSGRPDGESKREQITYGWHKKTL